ncbi:MAG TPA: hypothetical protein VL242_51995, partial [Sorangium sp.]|nr:hypothetical protein [Sorangium sp.]
EFYPAAREGGQLSTPKQRPGARSAGSGDVAGGARLPCPRDAPARLPRAGGELDMPGFAIAGRPRARGGCTS